MGGSDKDYRHHSRDRDYDRQDRSRRDIKRHHRHESDHHLRRSPDFLGSDDEDSRRHSRHSRHRSRSPHRHHHRRHGYHDRDDPDNEVEEGQCFDDDEDEDYDSYDDRRRQEEETPNNTIMLRGLPSHTNENDILGVVSHDGLVPKDVRLMRNRETGISRGFAFVEFNHLEDAIRWRQITQGVLSIEGNRVTLHYCLPKDSGGNLLKSDWTCFKCGVSNFKRRDECFKCGTSRQETDGASEGDEISPIPTNCLLFRNLALSSTADTVLTLVGSVSNLPIKSIHFDKNGDGQTQRSCFVELHTTVEATQLLNLISSVDTSSISSSTPLKVSYARRRGQGLTPVASKSNAATVALAAAKWTNQSEVPSTPEVATVVVNGVAYQKFPTPDPSKFVLETTSGFYYDHATRLYFDPKSKYYYNSITQKYLYWSPVYETYLPVESTEQKQQETSTSASSDSKTDSAVIEAAETKYESQEKKLKKDKEKPMIVKSINFKTLLPSHSAKDVSSEGSSRWTSPSSSEPVSLRKSPTPESSPEPEEHPKKILEREENRLIDWEKHLCLLCKRQLLSREQLTKHKDSSALHKTNLESLATSVLTGPQLLLLNSKQPIMEYIDRAKERRKKWGDNEAPKPNRFKEKYLKEGYSGSHSAPVTKPPEVKKIDSSNIGNRMLKAMGWKEGQGLGKKNTGRTEIIEVEARNETAGLGMKSSTTTTSVPGESYKDAVKRAMARRYQELSQKD